MTFLHKSRLVTYELPPRPERKFQKPDIHLPEVDHKVKFFGDEQFAGIDLVTDLHMVRNIHAELKSFTQKIGFAPGFAPEFLCTKNMDLIWKDYDPYVMGPRPTGPRYLLYINSVGDVFMMNTRLNIFSVDKNRAVKLYYSNPQPKEGLPTSSESVRFRGVASPSRQPATDTVLYGVITRERSNPSNDCLGAEMLAVGKLTFVILDAIKFNGDYLLNKYTILRRMSFVKEILTNYKECDNDIFKLDKTEYKVLTVADDYISSEFEHHYKYPLLFFVFIQAKKCGNSRRFQWVENGTPVFTLRLKIPEGCENNETALCLYALSSARSDHNRGTEVPYDPVVLTDELRKLNGLLINNRVVDGKHVFISLCPYRQYPDTTGVADLETLRTKTFAFTRKSSRHFKSVQVLG